eukprot:6413288-Amphidinium_carterae.1
MTSKCALTTLLVAMQELVQLSTQNVAEEQQLQLNKCSWSGESWKRTGMLNPSRDCSAYANNVASVEIETSMTSQPAKFNLNPICTSSVTHWA